MQSVGYLISVQKAWSEAWVVAGFRVRMISAIALAILLMVALPHFFAVIQGRPGMILNDPVLNAWGPMDLSDLTFLVLYSALVLAVLATLPFPHRLLQGMHAYLIMVCMRVGAMLMFTLEAPTDVIPLLDPVTQIFYPGKEPFLKDLFFSGHTASLVLVAIMVRQATVRLLLGAAALVVGLAVLAQHVHWTVDVLAAPVFAFLAWRLARFTAGA